MAWNIGLTHALRLLTEPVSSFASPARSTGATCCNASRARARCGSVKTMIHAGGFGAYSSFRAGWDCSSSFSSCVLFPRLPATVDERFRHTTSSAIRATVPISLFPTHLPQISLRKPIPFAGRTTMQRTRYTRVCRVS
ncbi:hypothetical protein PsYK624_154220 [Phanerochaete sordida]|uniref:Uncharacterized protein n=1 Tax=Phanerochaete sordida TaxID=48140 RepID=A0A9P3LLY4_9APHY|nr:hypothetical protein PsYK624_154220 [Phanerochaete sordida]